MRWQDWILAPMIGSVFWAAEVEAQVAGVLLGSVSTRRQRSRWIRSVLPGVIRRLAGGKYKLGALPCSMPEQNFWRFWDEKSRVDFDRCRAHLRRNVQEEMRGSGLGRELMEAYLRQLGQEGVPGVHLVATGQNEAACRLYDRLSFEILVRYRTLTWKGWLVVPLEKRISGLTRLSGRAR